MKKLPIVLLIIIIQSLNCYSQNQNLEKDSIVITNISKSFFNWYISSAKEKKDRFHEYSPMEIEDTNGMTTLDFSKYFQNLIDHSFSDSLLAKEKLSYKECLKNLATIRYSDYLKLQDLDDFEKINCDYDNYYRWTGGQELPNGYSVTKVKIGNENARVIGILDGFNREISVAFIKQQGKWKIWEIK